MYRRNLQENVRKALADAPVVLIHGARQVGKSTLIRSLIADGHPARFLTLDDPVTLAAATSDPTAFIASIGGPIAIDEIQRAPELVLAIKARVDERREPGAFLLTGSANVLMLPRLADSLAGRMDISTLWPLSQGEIEGRRETFVDTVFDRAPDPADFTGGVDVLRRAIAGGYPEAISRTESDRRDAWFRSYITTIMQRDVRDLASIEGLTQLPRLLQLLAARAATTINISEVSRTIGMSHTTLSRYLTLLETMFLVQMIPAWSTNLGKRTVRSPKIHFSDTGLMSHLIGIPDAISTIEHTMAGPLIENFVAMELRKQIGWSRRLPRLYHYRTQRGEEVDLILEDRDGRVVGIEVKASRNVNAASFKSLRSLAEALGDRFARGIVMHAGDSYATFGENFHAIPIAALWA